MCVCVRGEGEIEMCSVKQCVYCEGERELFTCDCGSQRPDTSRVLSSARQETHSRRGSGRRIFAFLLEAQCHPHFDRKLGGVLLQSCFLKILAAPTDQDIIKTTVSRPRPEQD